MIDEGFVPSRYPLTRKLETDIIVVGGGLTGVCCAITAARKGVRVCLIQDRPVLGGNASSEVRIWALGATSHMGNNNRWSREGGVINEIMTENLYRNKEGNPVLFDLVLIDKVLEEKNITLLLNTIVYQVEKTDSRTIREVVAYNASSETRYEISGRYFADCSGDGILSYLSGAAFRMGAEDKSIYQEGFSPDKNNYGELLGHTILFYMKDTGMPTPFIAPDMALKDVEKKISKIQNDEYFSIHHHGCKYWWIEYGGRLDTIHDTEDIKRELWRVVYGIWDYIKNSGRFPEMETYTLEWVGTIPGKRESRRMKGLYMMTQQDIIEQRHHYDAVSYGGWAIDLHPSDGVYADGRACNQWHSKGVYQIPYRCFLGGDVDNLMFGGRIASSSHVANGSTRVMCTSAHGGQVMGMALALCLQKHCQPSYFVSEDHIAELQRALIETGHFIPDVEVYHQENLLHLASLNVSSSLKFDGYRPNGKYRPLRYSTAALFPADGKLSLNMEVEADCETTLEVQLRISKRKNGYTPDVVLEKVFFPLCKGLQCIQVRFCQELAERQYVFVCFMANEHVALPESDQLLTGTTTVLNQVNKAVSNSGFQNPPEGMGVEAFEFWCPERYPQAKNIAFRLEHPVSIYGKENLLNSYSRPFGGTNAWVASFNDSQPEITIEWPKKMSVSQLSLFFDTDFDQAMETVQMGHHMNIIPYCVRSYSVTDIEGRQIAHIENNYQAVSHIAFSQPIETKGLRISLQAPSAQVPPSLFYIFVQGQKQ